MDTMNQPADTVLAVAAEPAPAIRQRQGGIDTLLATLKDTQLAVNARGIGVSVIAVLAFVYALSWAQRLLVPLLLGVIVAYTLNPLVTWLERLRIPRGAGTVLVMLTVMATLVLGAYSLRGQVQTVIEQLPAVASKFASGLARMRVSEIGNFQKMQNAANEVEMATNRAAGSPPPRQAATHVVVDQPTSRLGSFVWESSMGFVGALGQAAMVTFLVFFLLLGGDTFKRKLVRLTGPTLSKRKITVQILDDINASIQKYMLMLLATNLLVAASCWAVFHWIGLDNAGAWAVASGLLHLVPYLGPGVTAIAAGMAAFVQFDSFGMAFLVAAASLGIATVVGTFVTTWMTGRIANMNSAAVFISLLFWAWLWGIWGMLLSIPIIVIIKVISEHVDQLHPVAELLGD
jgi:predicted PurR-regulated permease PerM